MTNVLIPTIQDDIHAAAVALALSRAGHRAIRWFCSDLPQRCAASFAPGDGAGGLMPDIAIEDGCGPLPLQSVDVLWNRPALAGNSLPYLRAAASAACRSLYCFIKDSCSPLGTGAYLANSIENSALPWVAERRSVE